MPAEPRFVALVTAGVTQEVADALEAFIKDASDAELGRINAPEFASKHNLPVSKVIDGLVSAAHVGILDMAWNVTCPGCGGVLDAGADLRSFTKDQYPCALCAGSFEPTLDELVEVTFSVSPTIRRLPLHDPDLLSYWDHWRYVYKSSALVIPEGEAWSELCESLTIAEEPLSPGERLVLSIQLPPEFLILFEEITHSSVFLEVQGPESRTRQELSVTYSQGGTPHRTLTLQPGPARLTLENRTNRRLLTGLFRANEALHQMLARRRPFLTAKQVLTNQTFRNLFKADTLDVNQRIKISSITVLFTDLKGSTALYERVGDLAAYDIVRKHFRVLGDVVSEHEGAVVKTIGDAVMATFPTPQTGVAAALAMHSAMARFNAEQQREELTVKIGLHEGSALAVSLNDRLDYFGQTINIAARVQDLATATSLFTTEPVVLNPEVKRLFEQAHLSARPRKALLKGISEELTVYEIPL
ncbi:MAG TPA: DUF5939 domain-containing protein [Polyangiaceae bacterium]